MSYGFRYIDMEAYSRRRHFEYFSGLANPYVGITANADITGLPGTVRSEGLPFFLTVCYCVSRAAEQVPEFRQRIAGGRIVEYEHCRTSHTVALEDGTYCYCDLDAAGDFEEYIRYAAAEQEKAKGANSLSETEEDALDKIFVSTLPWISYTGLINPTPIPADSNPRVTWGKYFKQDDKVLLPLTVLCHHALVDGMHIARFYELFNKEASRLAIMQAL